MVIHFLLSIAISCLRMQMCQSIGKLWPKIGKLLKNIKRKNMFKDHVI